MRKTTSAAQERLELNLCRGKAATQIAPSNSVPEMIPHLPNEAPNPQCRRPAAGDGHLFFKRRRVRPVLRTSFDRLVFPQGSFTLNVDLVAFDEAPRLVRLF